MSNDDNFTLSLEDDEETVNEAPPSLPEQATASQKALTGESSSLSLDSAEEEPPTVAARAVPPPPALELTSDSPGSQSSASAAELASAAPEVVASQASNAMKDLAEAMKGEGPEEISSDVIARAFSAAQKAEEASKEKIEEPLKPSGREPSLSSSARQKKMLLDGAESAKRFIQSQPWPPTGRTRVALAVLFLSLVGIVVILTRGGEQEEAIRVAQPKSVSKREDAKDVAEAAKKKAAIIESVDWKGEYKDELFVSNIDLSSKGRAVERVSFTVENLVTPEISAEDLVKGVKRPWMRRLEIEEMIPAVAPRTDAAGEVSENAPLTGISHAPVPALDSITLGGKVYLEEGSLRKRILLPVLFSFDPQSAPETLSGTWEIAVGEPSADSPSVSSDTSSIIVGTDDGKYLVRAKGIFTALLQKKAEPQVPRKSLLDKRNFKANAGKKDKKKAKPRAIEEEGME